MEEERPDKATALCSQFSDELAAFMEGEGRPFVATHAHDCPACGALLADLESLRAAARELPQEEPSPAVWANVRACLAAEGILRGPACRQFDGELEAYLEGESRPFVAAHAQDCPACGALLADLESLRAAARELPQEDPSPAVWANVRACLTAEGILRGPACRQFDGELEAYLEGESRPLVAAHAQDCPACGVLLADLESLRAAARELPQEEPSPVVWANVRARLAAEGTFGSPVRGWREILAWRIFPQAIPVGVLAALVFLASVLTLPSSNWQRTNGREAVGGLPAFTRSASVLPTGDESALARVVSDLESDFRANETSMAPDLKATYDKSLASLDGSIRECLDSLRAEPRNTLAQDYLLTAYTRKAEVLSSALEFQGR